MPRRLFGHEPIEPHHIDPTDSWSDLFYELAGWFALNEDSMDDGAADVVLDRSLTDDDAEFTYSATVYVSTFGQVDEEEAPRREVHAGGQWRKVLDVADAKAA